jgi:putative hemolysin
MLDVKHGLHQRLPWLVNHPVISNVLSSMLRGVTNERRFNHLLVEAAGSRGLEFVDRMLELIGVRYEVEEDSAAPVPTQGPLIVVANHPLGVQDALVLLQWLGSIRPDVRMLGNDWLASVPPISNLLLPVDVFIFIGRWKTARR